MNLEVEHAEWRLQHGRLLVHCVFGAGPEPRLARPMWDEVLLSGPIVESTLADAIRTSLAGMCREASRDHLTRKDEAAEAALLGRALAKLKLATDDEMVHSL